MPKFNVIKNNFLKGEFSPRVFGRTDIEEYFQGAAQIKNMFGHTAGGVYKRRGSIFETDQRNFSTGGVPQGNETLDDTSRIFPFATSDGEQHIIIIRAFAPASSFGTNWEPISIYEVKSGTTLYAPAALTTDPFANVTETGFPQTPWGYIDTKTKLQELVHIQIADTIFFSGPDVPMFWIKKTTVDGSIFKTGAFWSQIPGFTTPLGQRFPFKNVNSNSNITMTPSATTGSITITFANVDELEEPYTKDWGDGIRVIRLNGGSVRVDSAGGFSPNDTLNCTVLETLSSTTATSLWQSSAWNIIDGFPSALGFFQQRLYTGGTKREPATIYASQIGDVQEFSIAIGGSIAADSAFSLGLSVLKKEVIRWFSSGVTLFIGTSDAEYKLTGPDSSVALSALNVDAIRETANGSSELSESIKVGNAVYFGDRTGNKIMEYVFTESEQAFRATDVMAFSDHMIEKSFIARESDPSTDPVNFPLRDPIEIDEIYYSNSEDIIFLKDTYSGLTAVAVDRGEGLFCPTQIVLGGSLDDNDFTKIHSICVMEQNQDDNVVGDQLFMYVERTVDGASKFTIEKIYLSEFKQSTLAPAYSTGESDITDDLPVYLDGAVIRSDSTTTDTVTGLDHLEGEVVDILADGLYVGQKTVSSGSVTLDDEAQIIVVGLIFDTRVKTLRIEAGGGTGSSQRSLKRVDEMLIRFFRTVHANAGSDDDNLQEINFRSVDDIPSDPIPLFTGDKIVKPNISWDRDQQLLITSTKPYPMYIAAIVMRGLTND